MVDIQEFDPSEIDDDNYEGMPELCDSDSGKKETVTEVHDDIGDGDRGDEKEEAPPPRSVDADGWKVTEAGTRWLPGYKDVVT